MAIVRTLKNAILYLRELDPDCEFKLHSLRALTAQGIIPSVTVGNKKRLVDVNVLQDFLSKGNVPQQTQAGAIRRIIT